MLCPECKSPSRVTDSRAQDGHRWRMRECTTCKHTFSTWESTMDPNKVARELKKFRAVIEGLV